MIKFSKIKNLHKSLKFIRAVELEISSKYQEYEMRCPVHLSVGQEAVSVGVCANLSTHDKVISGHRSHAVYLAKGGDLNSMIAEIYGKVTGCAKGLGGSMHLQDNSVGVVMSIPIVGSQIPIGAGISMFNKFKICKKKYLTVIFFGEGATEEGVFHETLNYASLHNLPILFVCENNFFSVYTHNNSRHHKKRSIKKIAEAHGIYSSSSDGNDVEKVFSLAKKKIDYIKKKNKPAFIEFKTYRWLEHCGPNWDDDLGYRSREEVKRWLKKCPISIIEKKYKKLKEVKYKLKLDEDIASKIKKAFSFAKKSKFPNQKILKVS